jgi:hypothetical protein
LVLVIVASSSWGCGHSSSGNPLAAGEGGAAALAGGGGGGVAGQSGAASGSAGSAGSAGSPPVPCPETVAAQVGANAELDLTTEVLFEGSALSPGQPNTLANVGVLTPLNLRFYMSRVTLLRADGPAAAADLVDATGTVKPYGVQLINTDDDSSLIVRLRGPAGSYAGIGFTLGLDDGCNAGSQERKAPLSATSGMTWPPPFGYLFFRYEGMFVPAVGETRLFPSAIHMGGIPGNLLAPVVSAAGSFELSASNAAQRRLRLMLDQVFAAALAPVDLSGFVGPPGDEIVAGERLRRAAPGVPLFVLAEP